MQRATEKGYTNYKRINKGHTIGTRMPLLTLGNEASLFLSCAIIISLRSSILSPSQGRTTLLDKIKWSLLTYFSTWQNRNTQAWTWHKNSESVSYGLMENFYIPHINKSVQVFHYIVATHSLLSRLLLTCYLSKHFFHKYLAFKLSVFPNEKKAFFNCFYYKGGDSSL